MSFDDQLQRAIQRGQRRSQAAHDAAMANALSEDELRRRHGAYRLRLSEHIELCIKKLPNHFPGFETEIIYGERGWGAACYRNDVRIEGGRRNQDYSRLEMTVRPYSSYHVLELTSKATIRNKEIFNRNHYELIADVDLAKFLELIDIWVLEFAEMYAAKS
jgi:hypothetical protein